MLPQQHTVDDLTFIDFPKFSEENGTLIVFEGRTHIPFAVSRIFIVTADAGALRGQHAHRQCAQLLVCLQGACTVRCDDGRRERIVRLSDARQGLLIPPTLWGEQTYEEAGTTLMVLCDRPYEAGDYIRDRHQFLLFRGMAKAMEI